MAEENIEVSAGCSHERLQFGHALPHLFWGGGDSQNFGSVGSVKREIKLVWPCLSANLKRPHPFGIAPPYLTFAALPLTLLL